MDCEGVAMREHAVLFGKTASLVGVMTDPPDTIRGESLPGIVLLNAGLVHRVGPQRLYVKIARSLAAMGFVVLRFDFSGIGDSDVRTDTLPFDESAISETREAMHYLHTASRCERFILMGICSGAKVSLQTACDDPRVVGVVLINPRGHLHDVDDAVSVSIRNRTLARHYWRIMASSSFRAKNWLKFITGKFEARDLVKVARGFQLGRLLLPQRRALPGVEKATADMRALAARGVYLLQVHSEGDKGLDYLHVVLSEEEIDELHACDKIRIETIDEADHTFNMLWSQQRLLQIIQRWLQTRWFG
jgi:pimeloyl-ACP methyl ester carboxylesterase